jgi:hypothetical protein
MFVEKGKSWLMFVTMTTMIIIQFFIIYVPSWQLPGQLHRQHSVDVINYITEKQKQR